MLSLETYCDAALAELEAQSLHRQLRGPVTGLISFADNDYLGLAQDPRVIAASIAACQEFGAGAGASRLVTGNHALYPKLEAKLASMKNTEAALVFGSGYTANIGIIPALVGPGDVVFADKLVHACIIDGARLSGAKLIRFAHNDMAHLETLLRKHRAEFKHALITTDHVFSMDGDVAPIADIATLAKNYDAWSLADDAHGLGIVKPAVANMDLWMGTLSKAAGGYGGYVCAARSVIDLLVSRARSLVFSTGLPPGVCGAALAALDIMEAEPERGARAMHHAQRVAEALALPKAQSAILPMVFGTAEATLEAAEKLKEKGILAIAIRPPTVSPGTARLRLAFTARHSDEDVHKLIASLRELR